MKPLVRIPVLALAVATVTSSVTPQTPGGRAMLDLSGPHWQMEGIRPGQGIREGFHEFFGEIASSMFNWNGAEVPGDVYTDLWRAGEIDDPHYGRNGLRAKWVLEREWWYRCQFGVPEAWRGRTLRLVFEGVDYSCDVWLNGTHLGRHEGMFSAFEFDVSSLLRCRSDRRANGLAVRRCSARGNGHPSILVRSREMTLAVAVGGPAAPATGEGQDVSAPVTTQGSLELAAAARVVKADERSRLGSSP